MKKTILYRKGEPYLIRRTLINTPWFSLKIHKIILSDPNEPHDHPWNYLSLILKGGYWEERVAQRSCPITGNNIVRRWLKPWSLLYRRGDRLHRLIIPEGKTCTTLVLTTKKWRKWGYLRQGNWIQYPHQ